MRSAALVILMPDEDEFSVAHLVRFSREFHTTHKPGNVQFAALLMCSDFLSILAGSQSLTGAIAYFSGGYDFLAKILPGIERKIEVIQAKKPMRKNLMGISGLA